MGLKEAQKDFGRFVSVSGTVEKLSEDFKKLNYREFNKKYQTKFKSNTSLRGTERRIVGEFRKNQLPAGVVLEKSYKTSKIKPVKKIVKGKTKKQIKKQYFKKFKYKKVSKTTKIKKGGYRRRWLFPYNLWDVKMQNWNKHKVECKRRLMLLKNAWEIFGSGIGIQQVYLQVKIEFVTPKNTYIDYMQFNSKATFSVRLVDLFDYCVDEFIRYLFSIYKKYPLSRVLEVKCVVLRFVK